MLSTKRLAISVSTARSSHTRRRHSDVVVLPIMVLCVVLFLLPLSVSAFTTWEVDGEIIYVEDKPLRSYGSRKSLHAPPLNKTSEPVEDPLAPFFYGKNDHIEAWSRWKTILLNDEIEDKRKKSEALGGKDGSGANGEVKVFLAKLSKSTKMVRGGYFSDRNIARQRVEILRQLMDNTTHSQVKLESIDSHSSLMRSALSVSNMFSPEALQLSTSLENRYQWITTQVFPHTLFTLERYDNDTTVETSPIRQFLEKTFPWLFLLPDVIPLDESAGELLKKEAQSMRFNLKLVGGFNKSTGKDSETVYNATSQNALIASINEKLKAIDRIMELKERAFAVVEALAYPYVIQLDQYILNRLQDIEAEMVKNDEATKEKRQLGKELAKERSALLALQAPILYASSDFAKVHYEKDAMLSPHSFVVGLAIVAKFRFGEPSGFFDLDNAPLPSSIGVPELGMMTEEVFPLLLEPLFFGLVANLLFQLLCDQIRRRVFLFLISLGKTSRKAKKTAQLLFRLLFISKTIALFVFPLFFGVVLGENRRIMSFDIFLLAPMEVKISLMAVFAVYGAAVLGLQFFVAGLHDWLSPLPTRLNVAKGKKED